MVQSSIALVMVGSRPMAMVAPAAMTRPTRVSPPTDDRPGPLRRLAHVHDHDHAQVVERGRGGVEHHDHGQHGQPAAALDGGQR